VQPPTLDFSDRRLVVAAAVAALALGLALSLEFSRCGAARARPEASSTRSKSLDAEAVKAVSAATLDELLEALARPASEPAVSSLTEELMRDSRFRGRWEELSRGKSPASRGAFRRSSL